MPNYLTISTLTLGSTVSRKIRLIKSEIKGHICAMILFNHSARWKSVCIRWVGILCVGTPSDLNSLYLARRWDSDRPSLLPATLLIRDFSELDYLIRNLFFVQNQTFLKPSMTLLVFDSTKNGPVDSTSDQKGPKWRKAKISNCPYNSKWHQ